MADETSQGSTSMSPEQLQALQEKIKNMSPEELREFQKKQCIFCQIVQGKVQAKKVYEDNRATAILDINPANPGHILLLPKEHYMIMPQIPEEEISHLFILAKSLSNAALRALHTEGTNILVANGISAGQKAQHFMIHIIPRKENDGVNFELPQREILEKDLEVIRQKLSDKIAAIYGKQAAGKKVQAKPKKAEAQTLAQAKSLSPTNKPKKGRAREPKTKQKKKEKKEAQGKTGEKPKHGINLDDIARLLGVR